MRLKPHPDSRQRLLQFDLDITPQPSFLTHHSDAENNSLTTAWFQGNHQSLEIVARSTVEVANNNPFDFILNDPAMTQLPILYTEPEKSLLNMYVVIETENLKPLEEFLRPILAQTKYETIPFLTELVTYIFSRFKRKERKSGGPWEPEKILQKGKGACRDYAWLFVLACRSVGLAARFVSGYHAPYNPRKKPELHSWAEIFLPGAGWIGFDPSLGLAISERHIALTASYNPTLTIPTSGKFWGKDVKSELRTFISIKPLQ